MLDRPTIHRALGLAALGAFAFVQSASATPYPTNTCVGAKMRAAAQECTSVFRAWSAWERHQDAARRDAALADAAERLAVEWTRAEDRSNTVGIDCAQTTETSAGVAGIIEAGAAATVASINGGLDLAGTAGHRTCGARLLRAAARRCKKVLQAEGDFIKRVDDTANATARRDELVARATGRFATSWANTTANGNCPTTATQSGTEAQLAGVEGDTRLANIFSPNVPSTFTQITPVPVNYLGKSLIPICSRSTPYSYFVKRGTVNKLVMYYQGGGACWNHNTCSTGLSLFDDDVEASDNPGLTTTGLGDLTNPLNPFKDWNIVFVSYCTGDVHFGDASQVYTLFSSVVPIEHKGFVNAQVVEKWAREHFVAPDELFITGSSAGAYGAIFNSAYLLSRTWPAARGFVLGDAGNGVITDEFLQGELSNWNFDANVPRFIPALDHPISELSFDEIYPAAADFFPNARFAQYTTAFDGGNGGQTSFYHVMLNSMSILNWPNWWQSSCAWNTEMEALAVATAAAAPANYRYYIGAGSRHVMYNADKVYTETKGGVPTVRDWITAMITDGVGWDNVLTTDVSRNPGTCAVDPMVSCFEDVDCTSGACNGEDPAPSPLVAPFGPGGAITCP